MYGKIEENKLVLAQNVLNIDGKYVLNPQQKDYLKAGYKPVEYAQILDLKEGVKLKEVYSELEDRIVVSYLEEEIVLTDSEKIQEILKELNELDLKTIRPLRAGETDRIQELENRAIELREELQTLLNP